MDSTIVIAVASITGTLVGIIATAITTYVLQKKNSERQRKWTLEDEGRKIKRDLLCKRLDLLEESAKIMMNHVRSSVARSFGEPMYDDHQELISSGKRLQNIRGEAWASIIALPPGNLSKSWRTIFSAYHELEETNEVSSESWRETHQAYVEMTKQIDEMKSQVW